MKLRSMWIIFIVSLLVTLPMRIYQVLFLVDPETGFYTNLSVFSNILSVLLAASVVIMAVLCFKNCPNKQYKAFKSTLLTVVSAISGLGMIILFVFSFLSASQAEKSLPDAIMTILGICSGIIFITAAYNFAVGENLFEKFELIALIPSLWGCAYLVKLFLECVSTVNIAENVYNTFTVSFLLLYLFTQAKLFTGIENEKSGKMIYVFGFPAVLMLLITGIPGTLMLFVNINQISALPRELYPINILMAAYIITFLFGFSHTQECKSVNIGNDFEVGVHTTEH